MNDLIPSLVMQPGMGQYELREPMLKIYDMKVDRVREDTV